jgi:hypothetical protein
LGGEGLGGLNGKERDDLAGVSSEGKMNVRALGAEKSPRVSLVFAHVDQRVVADVIPDSNGLGKVYWTRSLAPLQPLGIDGHRIVLPVPIGQVYLLSRLKYCPHLMGGIDEDA